MESSAVLPSQLSEFDKNGVRSALLTITSGAKNLSIMVDALCADLSNKNLKDGISLLFVKERLLIFYMQYLTDFIKLKVRGEKVEGNDIVDKLAEIRVYIERIQPIEKKLKYQIEKMLKVVAEGLTNENDPSRFRANPANMSLEADGEDDDDESGGDDEKKKAGVYVPPKLSAVHYDGDESRLERRKKIIERARKRALQSSVMQELKEEYLDTPVEVKATNSLKQAEDKIQKRKQEYEEEYFTRLPITKQDVKRAKRISTIGSLGDEVTHFEDLSVLHGDSSSVGKKNKTKKFKNRPSKKGGKKKFKKC